MKKDGRVTLSCVKILPNGIPERFYVTVMSNLVVDAKKNYESQGYKVSIVEGR